MAKIILIAVLLLIGSQINAAEKNGLFRLVYVFSNHCTFCKAWERDVGRLYEDTEYAKKAPLFKYILHIPELSTIFSTYFL